MNPKQRTFNSIYKTFVDSIHFRRSDLGEAAMSHAGGDAALDAPAIGGTMGGQAGQGGEDDALAGE